MSRTSNPLLALVGTLALLATVACGNSAASLSPTGPSALGGSTLLGADAMEVSGGGAAAPGVAGNSGKGKNSGPGNGASSGHSGRGSSDHPEDDERAGEDTQRGDGDELEPWEEMSGRGDNDRVEVGGRVAAIDPVAGTMTVGTTVVTTSPTTIIRHGSRMMTLTDITVGDHVAVKGTVTPEGVTATEIKVQERRGARDEHDDDSADDDGEEDIDEDDVSGAVQVSGAVSGKMGICPDLTLTVDTKTVTTDAMTVFHETTCLLLQDTMTVDVTGTLQPDGSIVASRVETTP